MSTSSLSFFFSSLVSDTGSYTKDEPEIAYEIII